MTQTKLWIAHSANDPIASVCHTFEQHLYDEALVLNDTPLYAIRDPADTEDMVTRGIHSADVVLALLTPDTDENDLVAQLRRAHSLHKPILALFFWARGERPPVMLPATNELRTLLSGFPHFYVHTSGLDDKLKHQLKTIASDGDDSREDKSNEDTKDGFDVFISKKSEDYGDAKAVHDFLNRNGKSAFLSEPSLLERGSSDYMKVIDEALETSQHFVLVARSIENIMSGWVEAEWRLFINEKRSGRKTGNVVTLLAPELPASSLPLSLRYYEVIPFHVDNLSRLLNYM